MIVFGREVKIKKELVVSLIFFLIAVILGTVIILKYQRGDELVIKNTKSQGENGQSASREKLGEKSTPEPLKEEAEIKIYITGAVKKPGIVTLKKGQILNDAVVLAGGFTEDADPDINLVYELTENTMIKVKSKKEGSLKEKEDTKPSSKNSGNKEAGLEKSEAGNGIEVVKDSGGAVVNETKVQPNEGKVNVNRANAEELDSLPGIGPKLAKDIIAYREKHGGFKHINDLLHVPGIGENKLSDMKDRVVVD